MFEGMVVSLLPLANLLLVLLSFLGWGKIVSRRVHPAPDWGLAIGWGMSVLLAMGGVLTALDLSRPLIVAGLLAFGLIGLAPHQCKRTAPLSVVLLMASACFMAVLIRHVFTEAPNTCDDHLTYMGFVEQMRATGGLEQPFSLRRLAAYGGQTFLQEATTLAGDWHGDMALETGLMPAVIFGLLLGTIGGKRPFVSSFVVFSYLLTFGFSEYRVNLASQATTVVLALTLLRTLELLRETVSALRLLIVAGLVAAGLCTLRDSNLAFPAVLFGALILLRHRPLDWRGYLQDGAPFALSWIAFLLPWAIALQKSSGTPLYPLIAGYHHADFETYRINSGWVTWSAHAWALLGYLYPAFGLGVAALLFGGSRLVFCGLLAALVSITLLVLLFPAAGILPLVRYSNPFVLAASYFALGIMLSRRLKPGPKLEIGVCVCGVAVMTLHLALLVQPPPPQSTRTRAYEARIVSYRAAQAQIPPGEKILVFAAGPFGFDMARNPIINLDLPGPVSPPPGMPFFQGAAALAQYLAGLGIRYVIYDNFDLPPAEALNICVNRTEWRLWETGEDIPARKLSPYGLDAMANLEAFSTFASIVFQQDGVIAVSLAGR